MTRGKAVLWLAVGIVAVAAATGGWMFTFRNKAQTSQVSEPAPQAAARDPLEVTVDEEFAKKIKVGAPEWAHVSGELSVPGRIEADETELARAGTPVAGRILDLKAAEGARVAKGQVLARVLSPDLSEGQLSLMKSLSQSQLADRSVGRARQLLDAGVIGAAELQRRQAELAQATAELVSARDRLRVLGMHEDDIARLEKTRVVESVSEVSASIDGVILERHATPGQVVQPSDTLFVIADLSQVWLVADVPEQSGGFIRPGKSLEAEIPALQGRVVRGHLSFVSATVSPESHTIRVRMDLPNPDGLFKPAMLANIRLRDGAERKMVIPTGAVVREGNQDVVLVQTAPNKFLMRPVTLGGEFDEKRVVIGGLKEGEPVVIDGAFHVNNERKRASLHTD